MNRLFRFLFLAALALSLAPSAAHAQFFGGSFGSYGGFGRFVYPYSAYGLPYGGGYGFPYYSGYVTGPQYYTTGAFIPPIVYTVTTPRSTYERDVPVEPRMRPASWPAIPYRDAAPDGVPARIDVRVPVASATVSFDGVPMRETGIERHFVTPALRAGAYSFEIRASWRDAAGKEMTRTRTIEVRPGETQSVDFIAAR